MYVDNGALRNALMEPTNKKGIQGAATRAVLVGRARRLFALGFDKVSTPAIATAADVTRGALYHHFADKRALFSAVVSEVAADIAQSVDAAAVPYADDPVGAVVVGSRAFVTACDDPETRQIFLLDAPAVLGWSAWRAIDAAHGLGSLKDGLAACARAGRLAEGDIDGIAHLISGALNEAVFVLASNPGDESLRTRLDTQIERLVRGVFDD